jgi:hypothetical protein
MPLDQNAVSEKPFTLLLLLVQLQLRRVPPALVGSCCRSSEPVHST